MSVRHLVILDLSMPHMGGEECLVSIRKIRRTVPVLLAIGYNETAIRYDLEADPFTEFTQKPYGYKHLKCEIQKLFSRTALHPTASEEGDWTDMGLLR